MANFWRPGRGRSRPAPRAADFALRRQAMVEQQIRRRGISDPRVLAALERIPRHLFVLPRHLDVAYGDHALSIGHGQTISQPYIVALMTACLRPGPGLTGLEVGTGSGYQAAVLAACGLRVDTIERIPPLAEKARSNLAAAGCLDDVELHLGDGSAGLPERAPFDRILIAAAAEEVPAPLFDQLAPGGLLVAPVGSPSLQRITRYTKDVEGGLGVERLEGARFVPLVRE